MIWLLFLVLCFGDAPYVCRQRILNLSAVIISRNRVDIAKQTHANRQVFLMWRENARKTHYLNFGAPSSFLFLEFEFYRGIPTHNQFHFVFFLRSISNTFTMTSEHKMFRPPRNHCLPLDHYSISTKATIINIYFTLASDIVPHEHTRRVHRCSYVSFSFRARCRRVKQQI